VITFNWKAPTLRTLEMALVVGPCNSSQMFLRESSTETNVSIEPLQFCRILGQQFRRSSRFPRVALFAQVVFRERDLGNTRNAATSRFAKLGDCAF
jgi:hypothetical protein